LIEFFPDCGDQTALQTQIADCAGEFRLGRFQSFRRADITLRAREIPW